jgi:hypothetical protein
MTILKKPKQLWPLVEVIWDDAAGLRHGWEDKVEKLEPQLCMSVGFLIFENTDHIILAMDMDAEGNHNGRSQIPKGMVKAVRVLRKAANGKKADLPSVPN